MSASENKKNARGKFEAVFERIRDDLVNHLTKNGMPSEAVEWYRKVHRRFFPSESRC